MGKKIQKAQAAYIEEMENWIAQERCRLESSEIGVKHCDEDIAIAKQLRVLMKRQTSITLRQITQGEEELAAYKKKHGIK